MLKKLKWLEKLVQWIKKRTLVEILLDHSEKVIASLENQIEEKIKEVNLMLLQTIAWKSKKSRPS